MAERVQAVANQVTAVTSVTLFGVGLTLSEWIAISGLLLGILSWATSSAINYWRTKSLIEIEKERLKLEKEDHDQHHPPT